jgi:hypothetical protein
MAVKVVDRAAAAARILRPPARTGTTVSRVRLAPDASGLAYVRDDGVEAAIELEAPDRQAHRLVALGDVTVSELVWSPDGQQLAYVVAGAVPSGLASSVGWADAVAGGERGRIEGATCAWTAKGKSLVVVDVQRQAVLQVDPIRAVAKMLGEVRDDGHPLHRARIAAAPSGVHVAVTTRRAAEQRCEVWLFSRTRTAVEQRLITQIPGADVHVVPFWSPRGRTLGLVVVHLPLRKSAIIAIAQLKGDGVILHDHAALDAAEPAAWSPSTQQLACWIAEGPQQRLTLVDTKTHTARPLGEATDVTGALRFLDETTLAVEAGDHVAIHDLR